MARATPIAVALFLAAACQRTPEEPAPAPVFTANISQSVSGVAPVTTAAPLAALPAPKRCIVQTPVEPPRSVPAGPAAGCPADPGGVGALPRVTLAFPDADAIHARVELARAESELERGLMYRKQMDDDAGMLFRMEHEVHTFWMHNTCIPLDMLFLDTDGVVVGIVENAPTLDDGPRSVACPSGWVLEMNAGWSRKHGVKAGQRVTIPPDALR
jgi:uncharacterized membrane protein (UPF0127 family)